MVETTGARKNLDPEVEQELGRLLGQAKIKVKRAQTQMPERSKVIPARMRPKAAPKQHGLKDQFSQENRELPSELPAEEEEQRVSEPEAEPAQSSTNQLRQNLGQRGKGNNQLREFGGERNQLTDSSIPSKQQNIQQARESTLRTELNRRLQSKKLEKAKAAVEKIAGKEGVAAKLKQVKQALNFLKGGTAASLIGIIVTFIIMNVQLILWGVKHLPFDGIAKNFNIKIELPLSLVEFLILILMWILVLIIISFFIIFIYLILNWWKYGINLS